MSGDIKTNDNKVVDFLTPQREASNEWVSFQPRIILGWFNEWGKS